MQRPDLNTLTCVNPACQLFRHAGAKNLVIRKVYGRNRIRLRRCRTCGKETLSDAGQPCATRSFRSPKLQGNR